MPWMIVGIGETDHLAQKLAIGVGLKYSLKNVIEPCITLDG